MQADFALCCELVANMLCVFLRVVCAKFIRAWGGGRCRKHQKRLFSKLHVYHVSPL